MDSKWIIIFVFAPLLTYGQTEYSSKIWQADIAYEQQDYRQSIKYYSEAFEIKNDQPIDLYNAACNYSLIKDKKMALKYLKKALKMGFSDYNHLYNDKDLYLLRHERKWKKLMRKFKIYDQLQIKID